MAAASLGTATGSRVDSAAKHTMACKIDTRFFKSTLVDPGDSGDNILHQDKYKYAMQKDEIVMNTTKRLFSTGGTAAYPLVVTTLGDHAGKDYMQKFLIQLYANSSATDFKKFCRKDDREKWKTKHISEEKDKPRFDTCINGLPEFRCQGVALGQAFATPLSGDTVATVLVGGMMTVMNGHFEMFAGTRASAPSCCARDRCIVLLAVPTRVSSDSRADARTDGI